MSVCPHAYTSVVTEEELVHFQTVRDIHRPNRIQKRETTDQLEH